MALESFNLRVSHFVSLFIPLEKVIPASYYDELPHLCFPKQRFSKEVVDASGKWLWLRGEMRFISDKGGLSSLRITVLQRDVMTFVYDGSRNFKVCIYSGSGGCEETRAVAQVIAVDDDDDYKEDSVCSLSSQDTNTSSEPETAQTVPSARNQGPDHSLVSFFHHLKLFRLIAFYTMNLCFLMR